MIWFVYVLAALALYGWAGRRLAIKDSPPAWARARATWAASERYARSDVKAAAILMFLFWPVLWPARHLWASFDVDRYDPVQQQRAIETQAARIRDLERELGI